MGPTEAGSPLRIAKNSLFPFSTNLVVRLLDLGFAVVLLKALGPDRVGQLTVAVVLVGYFDILVNFGLGTLLTRNVSRAPAEAPRYFWNSLAARLTLWLVLLPVLGLVVGPLAPTLAITPAIAGALTLFVVALLPGQVSGTASALLSAFERMEIPAAVTVVVNLVRVSLGVAVVVNGGGIVDLGWVSVVVSLFGMVVLLVLTARLLGLPEWSWEPRFAATLVSDSYPLMVNNLLNSVFFRIDVVVLQALAGAPMVGWYSTAYRFIDGLNVVPSSFVLAVFPLFARQAGESRARLDAAVAASLKVLLTLALPICVGTLVLAEPMILLLADERYLPHAAIALAILVWFLPLSFTNGLLQYVLIAVGRERVVTVGFFVAAGFNLGANLLLVPRYGYVASSVITVASEAALLGPFVLGLRGRVTPPPLGRLAWRPALAALAMGAALYPLRWVGLALIPLGAALYVVAMLLLGAGAEERALLATLRRR